MPKASPPQRPGDSNPRVPYRPSDRRGRLPFYEGKPLMVHLVFNLEHCPFDAPVPHAVVPPRGEVPDLLNFAWVEYGMVAGMPRLLRMVEERGLKASAFMNAACADVYPACAERILEAGWEIVAHGYVQRDLRAEADEEAVIEATLARLADLTGRRPRGWMGPGLGETFDTPDLLKKHGVEWTCDWFVDDLPRWMRTAHGPLIAMPYTMELNDVPVFQIQHHVSEEMHRRLRLTLAMLDSEPKTAPRVLTLALHPHLSGVAHRACYVARMLDELIARDDTVFLTGSDIADWFAAAEPPDLA